MKIIGIILSLLLVANTVFAGGNSFNSHYGHNFYDNQKVVVIEKRQIEFEDLGIRVVGIPVDLLGLKYYYSTRGENELNERDLDTLADILAEKVLKKLESKGIGGGGEIVPDPKPGLGDLEKRFSDVLTRNNCISCHTGEVVPKTNNLPDGIRLDVAPQDISLDVLNVLEEAVLGINPNVKKMPKNGKALDGADLNTVREYFKFRMKEGK